MARLVFLGSPAPAAVALRALVGAGHEVALVVTRPDARRGRGPARRANPVKEAAAELGVAVTHRLEDAVAVDAELGVVVAYGRIVPAAVLAALPMVNVHFSLLPRWRGAAPVERAVLAGDTETGVCVMALEETLDTGPVLARARVGIGAHEHAGELTARLAAVGAELLVDTLRAGVASLPAGVAQSGEPTYAEKVTAAELRLAWERPAAELERVVRLDRAWTTLDGERLLVLEARAVPGPDDDGAWGAGAPPGSVVGCAVRTGEGALELVTVQPSGRRAMPAPDWRRGLHADVVLLGDVPGPR